MEYLGRPSLLTGKVEMIEIVRIVNSVFESNTYLAISRNCDLCFLIDCGDPAPIIENINNRGLHLKGIFITHSHFDHIYGLDSIIDEYPETPIYISALGKEGLYSDKLNLSRYSLCPYVFQHYSVMKELKEGDTVYLYGSAGVEVYETPGLMGVSTISSKVAREASSISCSATHFTKCFTRVLGTLAFTPYIDM